MNDSQSSEHICAACGAAIDGTYAHCGICAADYCIACGSRHLCGESCRANGCIPGLCVKVVMDGVVSPKWGVPSELLPSSKPE